MNEYKHTQIGYTLIISYSLVLLALTSVNITTNFAPAAVLGLLFVLLALVTFATLTVTIDNQAIAVRFGPGLYRKRFPLNEIAHYQAVKNPWYYFLGIRFTPRGWLFAVSGTAAIELEMKSGKRFRIGTDEPERLIHALDNACDIL